MSENLFEIRKNEDGTVDEVLSSRVQSVHVEQLSDSQWWAGIYLTDGSMLRLCFYTQRARVDLTVEHEGKP